MDKLREKITAIVRSAAFPASDAVAEICDKTAELAADRILAIPEIAEALRITRGDVDGLVIVKEMTRDEIVSKFGQ